MKKHDLVARVSKKTGLSLKSSRFFIDQTFAAIAESIADKEDKIPMPGVGDLVRRDYPPRRSRNPRTGETILLPARSRYVLRLSRASAPNADDAGQTAEAAEA